MKFDLDIFIRIMVGILLIVTIGIFIFTGLSTIFKVLMVILFIVSFSYHMYKSKNDK